MTQSTLEIEDVIKFIAGIWLAQETRHKFNFTTIEVASGEYILRLLQAGLPSVLDLRYKVFKTDGIFYMQMDKEVFEFEFEVKPVSALRIKTGPATFLEFHRSVEPS